MFKLYSNMCVQPFNTYSCQCLVSVSMYLQMLFTRGHQKRGVVLGSVPSGCLWSCDISLNLFCGLLHCCDTVFPFVNKILKTLHTSIHKMSVVMIFAVAFRNCCNSLLYMKLYLFNTGNQTRTGKAINMYYNKKHIFEYYFQLLNDSFTV